MLKDITLGQFFPGNTIVHRLDPRTKLLAVVLYGVIIRRRMGGEQQNLQTLHDPDAE